MSDTKTILDFLSELSVHNDRAWFAEHKDWYENSKRSFEDLGNQVIRGLAGFDSEVSYLEAKDCIFRIYRDTRFSADKTPYKTHFGMFVAANGGRKSYRGGYYLHLEPGGNSMISGGVWCPTPDLLKALRKSVYDEIEEFDAILHENEFVQYYGGLWDMDVLKKIPRGYPNDWPYADYLKQKHYMVKHMLTDEEVVSGDFLSSVLEGFRLLVPFNRFLNYTVDEVLGHMQR